MKKLALTICFLLASTTVFAENTDFKIKIVDAEKINQVLADSTDNPLNYFNSNGLIPRSSAVSEAQRGTTLCLLRSSLSQVRTGEILDITSNNSGVQSDVVNWRTIAYTNLIGFGQFAVTCMSLSGPISMADILKNVNNSGIISID